VIGKGPGVRTGADAAAGDTHLHCGIQLGFLLRVKMQLQLRVSDAVLLKGEGENEENWISLPPRGSYWVP